MANILMLYHFSPPTTANYLARAFRAEGHDVRTSGTMASIQGFKTPYRLWGPHTYPLGEHETLDMGRLGDWKPDLILWVESGGARSAMIDVLETNIPTAGYFIDSHNPDKLAWNKRFAPLFDYRFEAMRPWCDELDAEWLPLACDPEIHTPRVYSEEYDLAWVGGPWGASPLYKRRFEAMARLQQRYRCNFVSGVYFEDMADVYGSAKIGWHMSVTGGDLDMRVFEVMCSGRPLVTDRAKDSGLFEIFGFRPDCAFYWEDMDGSMEQEIQHLLDNRDWRESLGATGRRTVLAAHTYQHRARQLLQAVGLE